MPNGGALQRPSGPEEVGTHMIAVGPRAELDSSSHVFPDLRLGLAWVMQLKL